VTRVHLQEDYRLPDEFRSEGTFLGETQDGTYADTWPYADAYE